MTEQPDPHAGRGKPDLTPEGIAKRGAARKSNDTARGWGLLIALALAIGAASLAAACGANEPSAEETACDHWFALAESDNPTDDEAARTMTTIIDLGPGGDIERAAIAMRARLEDGTDISATFTLMNEACGDV